MSEDQEPSIEEILSSIRQIIADDDEEEAVEEVAAEPEAETASEPESESKPEPEAEPEPEAAVESESEPEPAPEEEEEILDLSDVVEDEPVEIDMEEAEPLSEPEAESKPKPKPALDTAFEPEPAPEPIISAPTEEMTVESFAKLASYVPVDRRNMSTLEDIVRDMLKPMLRHWLDDNLPALVERLVREELERIGRQARDD